MFAEMCENFSNLSVVNSADQIQDNKLCLVLLFSPLHFFKVCTRPLGGATILNVGSLMPKNES